MFAIYSQDIQEVITIQINAPYVILDLKWFLKKQEKDVLGEKIQWRKAEPTSLTQGVLVQTFIWEEPYLFI